MHRIPKNHKKSLPEVEILFTSPDETEILNFIHQKSPNILFINPELKGINGFEFISTIKLSFPRILIVIISNNTALALKAIKLQCFDFLTKPLQLLELREFYNKLIKIEFTEIQRESADSSYIVVNRQDKAYFLEKKDIIKIEASGAYSDMYTVSGKVSASKSLSYYNNVLDTSTFLRIHRSIFVNINHIKQLNKSPDGTGELILTNNISVKLSKLKKDKFLNLIMELNKLPNRSFSELDEMID